MNKGCSSCPYGPGNLEEYAMAKQDPSSYCPDAYSERAQCCGMYDAVLVGKVGEEASCPKCAEEQEREKNLKMARELWEEFGDVIVDDNECIENPWRTFEAGTSRYDIWHWFENFFGVSVAQDLMEVA